MTTATLNGGVTTFDGVESIRVVSNGGNDAITTDAGFTLPLSVVGLKPVVLASRTGLRVTGSFSDPGDNQTWTGTIDLGDGSGLRTLALTPARTFTFDLAAEPTRDIAVAVRDNEGNVGSTVVAAPLRVTDVTPVGGANSPLTGLTVRYSRPIDAATFTRADVTVAGPFGAISPSDIVAVDGSTFTVRFAPAVQARGNFLVTVGPAVNDLAGGPMAAAQAFAFTTALAGPRVTAAVPVAPVGGALDGFTLTFTAVLDPASFPISAVAVNGPGGAVAVTGVGIAGATATVSFARQSAVGVYTLTLRPVVTDANGVQLDQNADGNPGQPADAYTVTASTRGTLAVQLAAGDVTEGAGVAGTVSRTGDLTAALTVHLASSNGNQLTVPADVEIAAGESSAAFTAATVNDTAIEKVESVKLTATATGFDPAEASVRVLDDDLPVLTLTLSAASDFEGAGVTGTVSRATVTDRPLVVKLQSSDATEATAPATVVIPAGQASATFVVSAVLDGVLDGPQAVTLTAYGSYTDCGCTITANAGVATLSVLDVDTAGLRLLLADAGILEGQSTTGTVTRNADPAAPLTVRLAASVGGVLTFPADVTIPAGQLSATFTVTAPDDGRTTGPRGVTLTATAAGLAAGAATLTVTDAAGADLSIAAGDVFAPATGLTGERVTVGYKVTNLGRATAGGPWVDRLYLSKDATLSADDTPLDPFNYAGDVPAGLYYQRSVPVFLPAASGNYWVIAVTDAGGALPEPLESNNTRASAAPIAVAASFTARLQAAKEVYAPGEVVRFTGPATRANGGPAAFETVAIRVVTGEFVRTIAALADDAGHFRATFTPLPGEAGAYTVAASHPGEPAVAAQDAFTVVGVTAVGPAAPTVVVEHTSASVALTLTNRTGVPLTGLTAEALGLPAGLTATFMLPTGNRLNGSASGQLLVTLTAGEFAATTPASVKIRVHSAEGATAEVTLPVTVVNQSAELTVTPGALSAGVVVGKQAVVTFTVTNTGSAASGPVTLQLPDLPWLTAATPTLPSLAAGQSATVSLVLTPPADLPLTQYTGWLTLAGATASKRVDFAFRAVTQAVGRLALTATDEYTYYAQGSPKVGGASVEVADPFTGAVVRTGATDALGQASFAGLPAGHYAVTVRADQHQTFRGTYLIDAGGEMVFEAFLPGEYVSYTWNVTPTNVQDKTHITVESVFQTNVPAPVVTIDPTSLDIPKLLAGGMQVITQLVLKNHGLIAAKDVRIQFPANDRYEFICPVVILGDLPANLGVAIPLIIRDKYFIVNPLPYNENTELATIHAIGVVQYTPTLQPLNDRLVALDQQYGPLPPPPPPGSVSSVEAASDDAPCPTKDCDHLKLDQSVPENRRRLDDTDDAMHTLWLAPANNWFGPEVGMMWEDYLGSDCQHPTGRRFFGNGSSVVDGNRLSSGFKSSITTRSWMDRLGDTFLDRLTQMIGSGRISCDIPASGRRIPIEQLIPRRELDALAASLNWNIPFEIPGNIAGGNGDSNYGDGSRSVSGDVILTAKKNSCDGVVSIAMTTNIKMTVNDAIDFCPGTIAGGLEAFFTTRMALLEANNRAFDVPFTVEFTTEPETRYVSGVSCGSKPCGPCNDQILILFGYDCGPNRVTNSARLAVHFSDDCPVGTGGSGGGVGGGAGAGGGGGGGTWFAPAPPCGTPSAASQGVEASDVGVCATVRIRLDQELVETRSAFDATLELINKQRASTLTDVRIDLVVRDSLGNDVTSRSSIRAPKLGGLTAVDGTGVVAGDSTGRVTWVIIPTDDAAPLGPTQYFVGGVLKYRDNGQLITVNLASAPITVLPNPALALHYFHQRDVFADDPFTEVVEPSQPYELGVLIKNAGAGDARDLGITSAQPKIVENEKGLLVDFRIVATEVDGRNLTPTLTADFGTVAAGHTAIGRWLFTSSLQGRFVDYSATFENTSALGDARLSIVKSVDIHELIHRVDAGENGDARPDFLTNDDGDVLGVPDTVWLSDGTARTVAVASGAAVAGTPTLADPTATLTATVPVGYAYVSALVTGDPRFKLVKAVRAGGIETPLGPNLWVTDRTFTLGSLRPTYETRVHLFVQDGSAAYTLVFEPVALPAVSVQSVGQPVPALRTVAVDTLDVTFSRPVDAATLDAADLMLTRNGTPAAVAGPLTVTPLGGSSYRLSGLAAFTTAFGDYALAVSSAGVTDAYGTAGAAGGAGASWSMGERSPFGRIVRGVAPGAAVTAPVVALTVEFSFPVDAATFTAADLGLTRDGGPDLLAGAAGVSVTRVTDLTFRVGGLAGFTATTGAYSFTVFAAGVKSPGGTAGTGSYVLEWGADTTIPVAATNLQYAPGPGTAGTVTGAVAAGRVTLFDTTTGRDLGVATVTGGTFAAAVDLGVAGNHRLRAASRAPRATRPTRHSTCSSTGRPPRSSRSPASRRAPARTPWPNSSYSSPTRSTRRRPPRSASGATAPTSRSSASRSRPWTRGRSRSPASGHSR